MPENPPKRVTLTKAQRETRAGSGLLDICIRITEDGRLSDVEIGELKLWLAQNAEPALPAIHFLSGIVEDILEDGIVTDVERSALQRALERVLPADVRTAAVGARREASKADARAEALASARVVVLSSKVRGVTFPNLDGRNRQTIIGQCRSGDSLLLEREPDNPVDPRAIRVLTVDGSQIGYISAGLVGSEGDRGIGWCLAKRMDSGIRFECRIKQLTGGDELYRGVNIDLAFWDGPVEAQPSGPLLPPYAASPDDSGFEEPSRRSGCGCLPGCLGLLLLASMLSAGLFARLAE